MNILLDTNILPADELISLLKSQGHNIFVGQATVHRELKNTDLEESISGLKVGRETFLFDEGTFPITFTENINNLEKILDIISTNSFPSNRENLTEGKKRQLRDALIFESAIIEDCDVICSKDGRAFFNHGKQQLLENEFKIMVLKPHELLSNINA